MGQFSSQRRASRGRREILRNLAKEARVLRMTCCEERDLDAQNDRREILRILVMITRMLRMTLKIYD